jgi:hypothetical protein
MCDFKYSTKLFSLFVAALLTNACSGGGGGRGNNKGKDQTIEQRREERRNGGKRDTSKDQSGQQKDRQENDQENENQKDHRNHPRDGRFRGQGRGDRSAVTMASNTESLPVIHASNIQDPEYKTEQVSPWVRKSERPAKETVTWKKITVEPVAATVPTGIVDAKKVEPKIEEKPAEKVEEKLKVKIIYTKDVNEGALLSAQTDVQKNNYLQSVRKLYSHMNVDGAYRAIPITDAIYEKTHVPTEKSPYITVALYQAIIESGACDINATGACLVVESDDRASQTKKRAYFITSSPENAKSKIIRVARQNLSLNNELVAAADVATLGEKNQITIFSQVSSLNESRDLNQYIYSGATTNPKLGVSNEEMDKVVDEVTSVLDPETQKYINDRLAVNSDRVDSLAGHCFIAADLKVQRRFIGLLLPRTYIDDAGQKKYKPTKEGKGRLYCYKRDGTRQAPKIQVQVIDRLISFGWRLSKGTEKFGAAALGWSIQGVQDIISIGSFRYLVSVDSSISNAFWNYLPGLWKVIGFYVRANVTPIIWGGKKGVGGVLATAAGIGLNDNIWSEASVSLLGEIKINFDPDEL